MAKTSWHKKRISHKTSFSILVLAIIIAAIPLTVVMSQRQQNAKQEASTTYPCGRCSTDSAHAGCWASWTDVSSSCSRSTYPPVTYNCPDSRCTAASPTPVRVSCPDAYGNVYGNCYDKNVYNCSAAWISGQCYGGSNIQCCQGRLTKKPTPTPTPRPCTSAGGICKPNNSATYYCSISINSGKCSYGYICCQSGSWLPR